MKPNFANYFRALLAVSLGILSAMTVGSFIGTPVNPTEYRQVMAKLDVAVQTGMVFRAGEADAYLAVPNQPDPPFWAAVLDWHAWLLVPGFILAFLVLRPSLFPALLSSCAGAAFLYYFVASNSAFISLGACAAGMLGVYGLEKTRRRVP